MAIFNTRELPDKPKARRGALFVAILNHLDVVDDNANKITSIALAGATHAKGDEARGDDGDVVARNLFEVVCRYSEDISHIHGLRQAFEILRREFDAS